jgi:Mg2+ and Co2+ transporter CorA
MADLTNQWQVETQCNASRAMAALAITIPITLSGKDANGVEFTERTRTIVIDKRGGKIATKCDLTPGSEMTLHNPIVGQTARIRILWVGEKRPAEEFYEVGVQLLGSENIWGIDFPSPERQESALQASDSGIHTARTVGATSSPEPSAVWKFAAPDAGSSPRPAKTGSPAPSLSAVSPQAPQASPLAVARATYPPPGGRSIASTEVSPPHLNMQRMESAGESNARQGKERTEDSSRSGSLPRQSHPPDSAKNLEGSKSLAGEHVKRLEGGLQACRSEMQQFGAQLEELKHAVQHEMGKTSRQAQESRPRFVELAINDLELKVKEEIDLVADELIDLAQKRVQEEVAAALEPLIQGALERVHSVAEEQSARAGEGIQDLLSRSIQEGQARLAHMLQSTTSQLQKEIRHISGTTIASAQAEITQARSKSAVGFEARLQETADEVAESAAKQLQRQAEDTLLLLSEQLETSGNDCIKRLEESLTKVEGEQQRAALSRFRKALEQECAETLAQAKGEATQAIREVSEQVQQGVQALDNLRNSLVEESARPLSRFQQDLERVMGEVAEQVQQQVNMLCSLLNLIEKESARVFSQVKNEVAQVVAESSLVAEQRTKVRGEEQQAADEILEAAAAQLGKKLEESLDLLSEELKLKQEEGASVVG